MYEDNAKQATAGNTVSVDAKSPGREEHLQRAIEEVRQIRQHLVNLTARITGMDTEPYQEECSPTSLSDLLAQQPEIIRVLCQQTHENIAKIESLLFD